MDINYKQQLPEKPLPICIIGAGGIVKDAHLPAYQKAGFEVWSLTDIEVEKAEKLAREYDVENVYDSVAETVAQAPDNAVYDLALVPDYFLEVLKQLPDNTPVLLQKPMGSSFDEARHIYSICQEKKLNAALNFQLRYAPFVNAARSLVEQDAIGELYDMEIRLTCHTPWPMFPSVMNKERLEILYHSIHYLDLVRSFLGDPQSVMAKTLRHPEKSTSSSRTTILFDYGDTLHAVINTNHDHEFGPKHEESFIKWEGTKGAIKAKMGLLLNYPEGVPDKFEYCLLDEDGEHEWKTKELEGSWFPDAFIGTMSSLMRYHTGETKELPTRVADSLKTMAVLEGAYTSSRRGGISLNEFNLAGEES
ncbi:Gfo/Idh/MocA family oxidoreductase [Aliifodinibius sp. S!AR15-10]|uniref:Gfo/Idh/MocA family protein n=1 Tax=Aliifodinibius sp. S!AR15-10 TaxID=2950437 RepID=UPI0028542015|nr:Gfo/Idh/MocA family oxidoreductase [Aliifodinibius sp. S!AR15-10]MDR8391184.1 Gfo/Idh/MocA family oxidoreductase [Aliifodinibius sp. S!AR15-10]